MTFNEIENEFDEKFFRATSQHGTSKVFDRVKFEVKVQDMHDFLKQSFIKYLQGEVEIMCKRQKNFDRKAILLQKKNNRTVREDMLFTRWASHASELEHQITHINQQLKELQ